MIRRSKLISRVEYVQNCSLNFLLHPISNIRVVLEILFELFVISTGAPKFLHPVITHIHSPVPQIEYLEIIPALATVRSQPHQFTGVLEPAEDISTGR